MTSMDSVLQASLSRYLPSEILEKLPSDINALNEAIQHLNSVYKNISAFLPHYIAQNEAWLMQDHGHFRQGTFMFADVSGFTALSERLRRELGAEGAELLTSVINQYFANMLDILTMSGGELLKFAGDAMLVFFPRQKNKDESPQAIRAGLRMQRAMKVQFQPIRHPELEKLLGNHEMQLTMSIGVSRGTLFEAIVGNLAQRDHIIMGSLPGKADQAEAAGTRDDVIVDLELAEHLKSKYQSEYTLEEIAGSPGFHQVLDTFDTELGDYELYVPAGRRVKTTVVTFDLSDPEVLFNDLKIQLNRVEQIARFVTSEVVNKLILKSGEQQRIESENRLATTLFVHFTGFAELLEIWGDEQLPLITNLLSRYYSTMQRVIAANGGSLNRSDPYKLGCKLLITFGAPIAHPDGPDRAVATPLEMHRQLKIFNDRVHNELKNQPHLKQAWEKWPYIKQRTGITQGEVFAGEVGWKARREYTVMGDEVNLAARMMSRAEWGQVIINQRVWERVHPSYSIEQLPPWQAKGKSKPIISYAVRESAQTIKGLTGTSETPFIGRDVTLLTLSMALQQVRGKRRRALALVGEAGIGKTRIARQIAHLAESSGFKIAWATCRFQNPRKATWASLVQQLLKIDPLQSLEDQKDELHRALEQLNSLTLEATLNELLFETPTDSQPSEQPYYNRPSSFTKRDDLLAKLSLLADEEQAQNTPPTPLGKRATARPSDLFSWSDLQSGMSLSEALLKLLDALSKVQPIMILIDDLHKENARAMKIHRRIVNGSKNMRLMFLATYEPPFKADLGLQQEAITDLREDETYLLASAMLNSAELGEHLRNYVWKNTNGRALFIESLIQSLIETQQLETDNGLVEFKSDINVEALPDSLRGFILSRFDRLPAAEQKILRAASIVGETFPLDILTTLSDNQTIEEILTLVENLTTLQILEPAGASSYRFKHGLSQQALYDSLTRIQRQKLHLKAAAFYASQEAIPPYIIAGIYHLQRAGRVTEAEARLIEAAENAEAHNNIEAAIELYTYALGVVSETAQIQARLDQLAQNEG